jgi:erythromycin esterase-like protein
MTVMIAPDAKEGSWEKAFHEAEARDRLIITDDLREEDGPMLGHRAIGVVYNPNFESGNYVPTDMANRYDAFIYLDETVALEPLPIGHFELREIPETFPVGE